MKILSMALFVLATGMMAVNGEARVYTVHTRGGYWHGHSRTWWVSHHYYWSGGGWVLSPGYGPIAPVYGYHPYRWHRYHRYHRWYRHY